MRESPALDIIHLLQKRGATGVLQRSVCARLRADGLVPAMESMDPEAGGAQADCVVIVTDHKSFDDGRLVERAELIVDTRNALKGRNSSKIVFYKTDLAPAITGGLCRDGVSMRVESIPAVTGRAGHGHLRPQRDRPALPVTAG